MLREVQLRAAPCGRQDGGAVPRRSMVGGEGVVSDGRLNVTRQVVLVVLEPEGRFMLLEPLDYGPVRLTIVEARAVAAWVLIHHVRSKVRWCRSLRLGEQVTEREAGGIRNLDVVAPQDAFERTREGGMEGEGD